MKTVVVGTIDLFQVSDELRNDLALVRKQIRTLVDSKPFGKHTDQDIRDYKDLRNQEESLILQLS